MARDTQKHEEKARAAIQTGLRWAEEESKRSKNKALPTGEPALAPIEAARKALQRLGVEMFKLDQEIWYLDQLHETKRWIGSSRLGSYGTEVSLVVQTLQRGLRVCSAARELADLARDLSCLFRDLEALHERFHTQGKLNHEEYHKWCSEVMEVVNAEPLSFRLVPPWRWEEERRVHSWGHEENRPKEANRPLEPVHFLHERLVHLMSECRWLHKSWEAAALAWSKEEWPPRWMPYSRSRAGAQPFEMDASEYNLFQKLESARASLARSRDRTNAERFYTLVVDVEYWRQAIDAVKNAIGPADPHIQGPEVIGFSRWSVELRSELDLLDRHVHRWEDGAFPQTIHGTLADYDADAIPVVARRHRVRALVAQRAALAVGRGTVDLAAKGATASLMKAAEAHDSDDVVGADTDRRRVQGHLLAKCERGEPYTSGRKLANELGCVEGTIRKAIHESKTLQAWKAQSVKPRAAPKATDLGALMKNNARQTREPTPDDVLPDDDVDAIMGRLIDRAKPEERAKLNALDDAGRRRMAAAAREHELDDEPSPLEPDKPGERLRKVRQHKRA